MPSYCFTTMDGETVERDFDRDSVPPHVMVRERKAYRNRCAEGVTGTVKGTKTPVKRGHGKWPMEPCFASGVNANQAGELRDFLQKRGVPTEVTRDGDPIYTSKKHREKALKVRGLHDRNSFD